MKDLLAWCAAHPEMAIPAIGATIVAAWKAIPAAKRTEIEQRWPRFANLMRFMAAVLPDVVKGLLSLRGAVTGTPKPLPAAPRPERATMLPPRGEQ